MKRVSQNEALRMVLTQPNWCHNKKRRFGLEETPRDVRAQGKVPVRSQAKEGGLRRHQALI